MQDSFYHMTQNLLCSSHFVYVVGATSCLLNLGKCCGHIGVVVNVYKLKKHIL